MPLIVLKSLNSTLSACGFTTSVPPRYVYDSTTTTTLPAGVNDTLKVTFGTDGSAFCGAWIDYNHDGVYNSTNEFLGANSTSVGAGGVASIIFVVPTTAFNGVTRMRVVGGNDAALVSTNACGSGTSGWGETRDFTITITGAGFPSGYTSYTWSEGGTTVGTGNPLVLTVPTAGSHSYIVTASNASGCGLVSSPAGVNVAELPGAPSDPVNSSQCGAGIPAISVTASGGNGHVHWYADSTSTSEYPGAGNNQTFGASISNTDTLWASQDAGGCQGARVAVIAVVTQPDVITIVPSSNPVCGNDPLTLSATRTTYANNYTHHWSATPSTGSGISSSGFGGTIADSIITVTPTTGGTFTYRDTAYDAATQCTYISSVTVTTTAPPAASITASRDSVCSGGPITLTAPAAVVNLNYTEGFEGTFPPTGFTMINAGTGNSWVTSTVFHSGAKAMAYNFSSTQPANAWAITPGQQLYAGVTYNVSFWYKVISASFPEKLKVTVGTSNTVPAQTTILWNNNGGSSLTNTTYAQGTATYTPSSDGIYYFGWNCYSDLDEDVLYVDDISITGSLSLARTWLWSGSPSGATAGLPGDVTTRIITVNPTATTTYTVRVTDPGTSCHTDATKTITVMPIPGSADVHDGTHCGTDYPKFYTTRTTAGNTFNWYTNGTTGSAISGQHDSILTLSNISSDTTFWVTEVSTFGCEGPRTAIHETVISADQITASASPDTVCPYATVNLSTSQTGSTNVYDTYTWTTSPGSDTTVVFTSSTTHPAPNKPGTLIWKVVAVDHTLGCTVTAQDTIFVKTPPVISSITASADSVCPGSPVTLTAVTPVVANGTTTLGVQTTTGIGGSPYRGGAGSTVGNKVQYLFTATELLNGGLYPGYITSLAFNVTSAVATYNIPNFTIRMDSTTATSLASPFATAPANIVFGPTTLASPSATGYNTHALAGSGFLWNGTSNIIVQVCNDPISPVATSLNVSLDAAGSGKMVYQNDAASCAGTTSITTTNRAVIKFGGQVATYGAGTLAWLWSPCSTGCTSGKGVLTLQQPAILN